MLKPIRFALQVSLLAIVWLAILHVAGTAQAAMVAGFASCGTAATPGATATSTGSGGDHGTPVPAGSAVLRLAADVPMPGGASRFDYQSLDPTTGRLYIAHMGVGQLVVFDTKHRAVVATVADLPMVTGVLAVPALGHVYAAVAGDHRVDVVDNQSLKVIDRLGTIGFPDGLDYAPQAKRVFVSDGSGSGEVVIDASTDKVLTTIDIGGEAGNTHYDAGSGCILVTVKSRNQLAAIDPTSNQVVGRFDLGGGCQGPHGFALDAQARLAFITCEDNAKLVVVNLVSAQVTASFPVGNGRDVLAFDPGWERLYVAAESGLVAVFAEDDGALDPIGQLSIPHAHSVAVDPTTHLVYFPLENIDGHPVLRIMTPTPPRA
ncbi:MAG: YncE family protein [Thermomicrobiales bacterium]